MLGARRARSLQSWRDGRIVRRRQRLRLGRAALPRRLPPPTATPRLLSASCARLPAGPNPELPIRGPHVLSDVEEAIDTLR
jgi:hypothetical protein